MKRLTIALGLSLVLAGTTSLVRAAESATFDSLVEPFLDSYCMDCHDAETRKGEVSFENLNGVDAGNAELWKRIWEQVALKEMPPRKKKNQPGAMDRLRLSNWITGELKVVMKDRGGFHAHLLPAKGNHLDHDLLFGKIPEGLDPPSTPARIWRVHPQEHLVRLNDLINVEPAYDPATPGVRTRGDHIPWNQEGEIKVYYGLDRLIGWVGGSAAYAAAITGFPPVLNTIADHGLQNYSALYSVNGAEATQIASHAEDILRFMAYGPAAEPYQFADKVGEIDQKHKHESLRGLSQSLFYGRTPKRPLTPVHELMKGPDVAQEKLRAAIDHLFEALTFRLPTALETETYLVLANEAINDLGKEDGAILGLVPIFLDRDALFRPELAEAGTPDAHGRVMLQDHELALAINAAFSYIAPDQQLKDAVQQGRLKTRADAKREVARILADDSIRKPRVLQFFREYFDYDRAGRICKDAAALKNAGGEEKSHYRAMFGMTAQTDRLVELIVAEDREVLKELLTTDRVVLDVGQDRRYYGEKVDPKSNPPARPAPTEGTPKKKRKKPSLPRTIRVPQLPKGETIHVRVAEVVRGNKSQRTLTKLPSEQRMGILTQPSWLVSHSDAMDNHAILRGRWVRERLLGGSVPDVPITVDAMLPDEPKTTLRHRMRVTRQNECWRCHQKMDPLGLPFEMYNHLGLYRTMELDQPVDSSGEIINSGDPALDGKVDDALDMIRKLAASDRVEQVFVRHAFRYWMGRNETLEDAPVLQGAYRAYKESNGSMKALIASLVTSDAFLYRKVERSD